ncbi:uncharacterized protein LOC100826374 [Brachypodium distachyon]|uniref:Uncharacterized protein n=1 Tax=Brachypodium distachyon TaxID=15368 RepID=I1INL2_BRADI|nr:uncharacterized protein LOC100826374 [Brachypodium distachyon]KQJ89463.1 hypothetical protein BRADI_4g25870v3 [Brachypodium distachyon]|eukprot:XP_010237951.1 uncharacterized protein LOC100826374 [Brachypodium distachyon]
MVDIHECAVPAPVPEPEPSQAAAAAGEGEGRPDPASISAERWRAFEEAALGVVGRIQPSAPSEGRRAAVVHYVQRLVRHAVGCEVFPFGSVPLKTYLPDGDIDLTAFGSISSDENLANEVRAVLESEELRKDAEFEVKDVQYIHAEVKLVKCLVQNIVVDISFNQIGGLCTLCFLEQVDQRFGKEHLFKKSIMLIKAWCYYESRILGAHHGLISTYALEILVLCIFHLFHKSLDGPLAVLYRFLDYYSKFDWDNKGISLYGPVLLSSLPELVSDAPVTHDGDFLKREEFLRECAQTFTVPPRNSEKNTRLFSRKFLNIVDPLKQNNNLGRSVSKGNFFRIRSAFDLGARKLGKILKEASSSAVPEVNQFFRNTLKRNRTMVRPDVQDIALDFSVERDNEDHTPLYSNSYGDLSDQFNNINISDLNNHRSLKEKEQSPMTEHEEIKSVSNPVTNSSSVWDGSDFCEVAPSNSEILPSGNGHYDPQLFYEPGNGKEGVNYDMNLSHHGMSSKGYTGTKYVNENSHLVDNRLPTATVDNRLAAAKESNGSGAQAREVGGDGSTSNDILSDLTGDHGTNLNNLFFAQACHLEYPMNPDYPVNPVYYPMHAPPPVQYQNNRSPNGHSRKHAYGYAGTSGIAPGSYPSPGYYVVRPLFQTDDHMRARGTGTYFPDPALCKDRPPAGRGERGRHNSHPNPYQRGNRYGRMDMHPDMVPSDEWRQGPSLQIYVPGANDHGIPPLLNIPSSSPSPRAPRDIAHGNGFNHPQDSKLEFGTLGALPLEVNQASRPSSAANNQASAPVSPVSPAPNPGKGSSRVRNAGPYHLKDNGDFPPLSS